MEDLKQEQVRSMIKNFFMENWTKGKKSYGDSAIHHFKSRRFEEGVGAKRKSGSGRPTVKLPPKQVNKMIKEILSNVGVSQASHNDWKSLKEE